MFAQSAGQRIKNRPVGRREGGERMNLKEVSTKELVEELKQREGVEAHIIGPSALITVQADGPAIVLVVID